MAAKKVLGIVGWRNSGKTTLVEALVRELTRRGSKISTVKHAHHAFDIDLPGKDSYRHREAGAREVLITSDARWALIHEMNDHEMTPPEALLEKLAPCDLILVEGYKLGLYPKIEVTRSAPDEGLIADKDPSVIAVATTDSVFAGSHRALPLNETSAIADFISVLFDLPTIGKTSDQA